MKKTSRNAPHGITSYFPTWGLCFYIYIDWFQNPVSLGNFYFFLLVFVMKLHFLWLESSGKRTEVKRERGKILIPIWQVFELFLFCFYIGLLLVFSFKLLVLHCGSPNIRVTFSMEPRFELLDFLPITFPKGWEAWSRKLNRLIVTWSLLIGESTILMLIWQR